MRDRSNQMRIGVFYDGNFLLHTSNYYNYIHPRHRRLSINGLHEFIRHRVAEEEDLDYRNCIITESHYFRGRINASEASNRGTQLYNDRVFDDILMAEGVHTHYLPLRNLQGRKEERGIDVWLALEVYELALLNRLDMVVLLVSDTDYVQLLRKLRSLGVPVMLLGWEFEYRNDDGVKVSTRTSRELIQLATYPIAMHDVIDCGLEQNNILISNLFVGADNRFSSYETEQNNETDSENNIDTDTDSDEDLDIDMDIEEVPFKISEIMMVKNGYGFIKYPNNNLFFHYLDVEGDFQELRQYDYVTFEIGKNDKGQDVAKKVRKLTQEEIDTYVQMD
ncbi:MAG: NYN domain-containing protein [Rikenellaceae bacterium]|nr:NYN domain-containing protein [Rikenellaceae bacterium]